MSRPWVCIFRYRQVDSRTVRWVHLLLYVVPSFLHSFFKRLFVHSNQISFLPMFSRAIQLYRRTRVCFEQKVFWGGLQNPWYATKNNYIIIIIIHKDMFHSRRSCFISLLSLTVSDKKWTELDAVQHRAHAMRLLDGLEVIARERRLKVARAILYMAQGKAKYPTHEGLIYP